MSKQNPNLAENTEKWNFQSKSSFNIPTSFLVVCFQMCTQLKWKKTELWKFLLYRNKDLLLHQNMPITVFHVQPSDVPQSQTWNLSCKAKMSSRLSTTIYLFSSSTNYVWIWTISPFWGGGSEPIWTSVLPSHFRHPPKKRLVQPLHFRD